MCSPRHRRPRITRQRDRQRGRDRMRLTMSTLVKQINGDEEYDSEAADRSTDSEDRDSVSSLIQVLLQLTSRS